MATKIDLKTEQLCKKFNVKELYLFGSATTENFSEDNDLDFIVKFDHQGFEGAFDQFIDFKQELEIFIDQKKAESPEFAENFEEGYLNFKIGVILRQARENMGATQADVAEKLNTTKSVISRMENYAEDIKLSTLTKYAKALGKKIKLEIQ